MPAFLAPLFLAGAILIAIPIIVHLTHKEKQHVQRFPSLMFVRQIPYRSTRKQRIRHWFLLLLRALAIILIAGAFARPWLEREIPPLPAGTGARELVILLDRSSSMAYQGRWDVAKKAAADALNSVGDGERATLVLFDEKADAVRAQEGDLVPLRAALNEAKPGSLGTRYAPPLRLAQSLLQTSQLPRREVILISDLQKTGWNAREAIELPQGATLQVVDVGSENSNNIAVAAVNFARANFSGRERVTTSARVLNRSKDPVTIPVVLTLNDREIERKNVTIEPNQAGVVQFTEFTLAGPLRGVVSAGIDPLPADNKHYFMLSPGQVAPVSLVRVPGSRSEETLYMESALEAPGEPSFEVGVFGQTLPDEGMRRGAVVILTDVEPTGADGRRLLRFVENGGGLLVIAGGRTGNWGGAARPLLPGDIGGIVEREVAAPARIANIQYGHRIFEAFRAPRAGDFTSAHFYRYRAVKPGPEDAVLARFDDGQPALIERRVGGGRVLLWTSSLDNLWNDVPVQPVFAPFLREAAAYLAGPASEGVAYKAGEILDLGALVGTVAQRNRRNIVVAAPSGEREDVEATAGAFLPLTEQGFYNLRIPGEQSTRTVAVNLDLSESDLTRVSPDEIKSAVVNTRVDPSAAVAEELTPIDRERRQSLWWYLLLIALFMLAAESVISNRLSRVARA